MSYASGGGGGQVYFPGYAHSQLSSGIIYSGGSSSGYYSGGGGIYSSYAPSRQSSENAYYSGGEPVQRPVVYFQNGKSSPANNNPPLGQYYNAGDDNNSPSHAGVNTRGGGGGTTSGGGGACNNNCGGDEAGHEGLSAEFDLLNYPYINYNRCRGMVWIAAGYDVILPVVMVFLRIAQAADGNSGVVESMLTTLLIYPGQFMMGVCLAMGLLNDSTTSTEAYCRWWLRGSYVLTTLLGLAVVVLAIAHFQQGRENVFGDWVRTDEDGRFGEALVKLVGVLLVPRLLGLVVVRKFMADLRIFHEQKEVVLNTLVLIARSRGVLQAQQIQLERNNTATSSLLDHNAANNVNTNCSSDDAWLAYIPIPR